MPKTVTKEETRTCPECGGKFTASTKRYDKRDDIKPWGQQYCRRSCWKRANSEDTRSIWAKTCRWCGEDFKVTRSSLKQGDDIKNARNQHCSLACSQLARFKMDSDPRLLSDEEAAYLAGIMDGEGTIIPVKDKDGEGNRSLWRAIISNTDREMLGWCRERTGGMGSISERKRQKEEHTLCYGWQMYSAEALILLRQIRPYMKIKAEEADRAIADLSSYLKPAHFWRDEIRELFAEATR